VSGVLHLAPWRQQPQGAQRLDPSDPLAQGCILFATGSAFANATSPRPLNGGSGVVSTAEGLAFDLNGTSHGLGVPHTRTRTAYTFWARVFNTSNDTDSTYVSLGTSSGNYLILDRRGSGFTYEYRAIQFSGAFGGVTVGLSSGQGIGQWVDLCGVFLGGTNNLIYVNGVQQSATPIGGSASDWPSDVVDVQIGALTRSGDPNRLTGQVLIGGAWDRQLTAREIASLSNRARRWQLFAPRQIWVPSAAAAPALPTMSAPRAKAGSVTSTGWISQVTAS
jgi:hypothetical protein